MSKKTFECAQLAQAILITQVKNNQKILLKQIQHGCRIYNRLELFESEWEKHHGRLEYREYESFSALPMLDKWQDEWGSITQVIRVTRHRERLGSSQDMTAEVSYYVSNRQIPIEQAQQAIRRHWHIENKLHYVKDVSFCEDKNVKRINPLLFSTCIDFALNRLRLAGCTNVKNKIYEISLDINKLLNDQELLL